MTLLVLGIMLMSDWVRTKKEWEFAQEVNNNYLPRVRVLYPFNVVRQYYMDLSDEVRHVVDFKDACKIKIVPIEKITDDMENVEDRLEEVYSKKVRYL